MLRQNFLPNVFSFLNKQNFKILASCLVLCYLEFHMHFLDVRFDSFMAC